GRGGSGHCRPSPDRRSAAGAEDRSPDPGRSLSEGCRPCHLGRDEGARLMKRSIPADRLRLALLARGWSLSDLAREAGVHVDTITRALEAGASLSVQTESKIAGALGRHPVDEDASAGLREVTA